MDPSFRWDDDLCLWWRRSREARNVNRYRTTRIRGGPLRPNGGCPRQ